MTMRSFRRSTSFTSISYRTRCAVGSTWPVNLTSPTPSARPRPGSPSHGRKKPASCHIASRPRQPGITGSPSKWQAKNHRSGRISSSATSWPLPKAPPSSVMRVMRSNISIGGAGRRALPGPNIVPWAHSSNCWVSREAGRDMERTVMGREAATQLAATRRGAYELMKHPPCDSAREVGRWKLATIRIMGVRPRVSRLPAFSKLAAGGRGDEQPGGSPRLVRRLRSRTAGTRDVRMLAASQTERSGQCLAYVNLGGQHLVEADMTALLHSALGEQQVLVRGDAGAGQAGRHAGQCAAVERQDRPPALCGLHQRRHATADAGDARHLRGAVAVEPDGDLVGHLRGTGTARARIDQGNLPAHAIVFPGTHGCAHSSCSHSLVVSRAKSSLR